MQPQHDYVADTAYLNGFMSKLVDRDSQTVMHGRHCTELTFDEPDDWARNGDNFIVIVTIWGCAGRWKHSRIDSLRS